jgi:hypothetical protein
MYDNVSLKSKIHENGSKQIVIKSPNGLIYTIVDNYPDVYHTHLKLTYLDDLIFEQSIDKFKEDAVFDTKYFSNTKHHYLFRMDKDSLKKFLDETNRKIIVPFSHYYDHYLYIDGYQYQLDFSSHELNLTSDMDYDNNNKPNKDHKWVFTYDEVRETAIARIVDNHSNDRYTIDGYARPSEYRHYHIVGDHFQLIGVFNGHFQELFSLRYSPKTLELHFKNVKGEYAYLTNQSFDDLTLIFKNEFCNWLSMDGDATVKFALSDYEFNEISLDDTLNLLEMAII